MTRSKLLKQRLNLLPLLKLKLHHLPKLKRKLTQMLNLLRKVNLRRKLSLHRKPSPHRKPNQLQRPSPLQKLSLHHRRNLVLNPALKQRESSLKLTKPQQLCKEERLHLLAKLPVAAVGVEAEAAAQAAKGVPAVAADKSPWDNTTRWQ